MGELHQIVEKKDSEALAGFPSRNGQALLPMVGLIERGQVVAEKSTELMGWTAPWAVLERRAAQAARPPHLEGQVRLACRDIFRDSRLLDRIVPDIAQALGIDEEPEDEGYDEDPALPAELWEPKILDDDGSEGATSGGDLDGSADR